MTKIMIELDYCIKRGWLFTHKATLSLSFLMLNHKRFENNESNKGAAKAAPVGGHTYTFEIKRKTLLLNPITAAAPAWFPPLRGVPSRREFDFMYSTCCVVTWQSALSSRPSASVHSNSEVRTERPHSWKGILLACPHLFNTSQLLCITTVFVCFLDENCRGSSENQGQFISGDQNAK